MAGVAGLTAWSMDDIARVPPPRVNPINVGVIRAGWMMFKRSQGPNYCCDPEAWTCS